MQRQDLTETARAAATAAAATTTALLVAGAASGCPWAPVNATSHLLLGEDAAARKSFDRRASLVGLAMNALSVSAWAALHRMVVRRTGLGSGMAGVLVAGAAWIADYRILPPRLAPGFEKRLGRVGLAGVYGALAWGLGARGTVRGPRRLPRRLKSRATKGTKSPCGD